MSIQELMNDSKNTNLSITGIKEEWEKNSKDIRNVFIEIIAEHSKYRLKWIL